MAVNKGISYDKMVYEKSGDELGLFDQYENILQTVRDKISNNKFKSIIDFGCGTGNLCGPLSDSLNVVGIDRNIEMIEVGRNKFPKMTFIEDSFLDLTVIKDQADVVVSSYVLHGLLEDEKQQAISNMLKLSKNNKIIIIDFMFKNMAAKKRCKDNLLKNNQNELWQFIESKNYFIVENFKKHIKKLNLKARFEHIVNFTWIVEIMSEYI